MTPKKPAPSITRTHPPAGGGTGFAKVFAFLRERLLEGTLRSGDRLMPERELRQRAGISDAMEEAAATI